MPQLYHFIADQFKENLMLGCQPHQQHMVAGRLCQYLKSWQLDGLRFLYKNYEKGEACILNDESGLGKVVTVSTFLGSILTNDTTKKCLIIVRDDEAIEGWRFHLSVLTHLTVKVIERTSDINFETVYLIKWSTLKNISEIDKVNFDHIIIDNRGEMINNKFCTGILLRYFENKTTIIISSVDVTSDIKLLHILLRLCGRLDKQYTDVKTFEDKFQLPQLREGVSNKVDLEDYFLKRERVINFCREFRLRRYCHQFDDEFPIVSRSQFQRHLEQWKNQNKNSLSSGSVKLLSSSSEKDTEELFNSYFQIKKERDTHRLDNEVQRFNESLTAIDDDYENEADASDDVVVMSPLVLVSESESDDDDHIQIQFERNSQYIEEFKDEDDKKKKEDNVKNTSKDSSKISSVNRRKSKKPVKTLEKTHLDDSKTLRSRALPSPKRPLPIHTKSRKSAETDKANVESVSAKRKRSDVHEDKETKKRHKNEETIKKINQKEKTKVNKEIESKKEKGNREEKKGSFEEVDQKKSKESREEKKSSSTEAEKNKSKEYREEKKGSFSGVGQKKSKESREEKKGSSSDVEKKNPKENQEEKKGSFSKREDDKQNNINKDKKKVIEDDKLSKIKKHKSDKSEDKKPEESSKCKDSREADKKSTSSKPKESPKTAQKDTNTTPHQTTKSEKTNKTQEKQKARKDEPEKTRGDHKKQEKNPSKQLEKDSNTSSSHQSKDKSKKKDEHVNKKHTKDNKKDDVSSPQRNRYDVVLKSQKPYLSLMFEEAQKFVSNENIGRTAKKSNNTDRRRSKNLEIPKVVVVNTPKSKPSPSNESISSSKISKTPKESKQTDSDHKDKSETPKRTVHAKNLTELAPLGVHSKSTRGMSRQTRSAVPTSKYMKVAIAQVDITKKSPKTPKRLVRDQRKSIVLVKKMSPTVKISKQQPPPRSPTPPVISESPVESMQLGQVLTPTNGLIVSDFVAPAPKNNDYHFPMMLDKETSDSECQITSQASNNQEVIVLTGSSSNDCEMEPPKSTVSRRKAFSKMPMVTIHRPMFNKAKSPDLFSTCSDISLPCSQQQTSKSHFEGFKIFGSELRQPAAQPRSCLDILERMLEPRSGIVAGKKNTPTQEKPRSSPHHHCIEDEDAMFEITSNGTFGNTLRVNSNGEMSPIRNKNQSTPPPSGHPKNRITNYLISNSQHTSLIATNPQNPSLEDPTDLLPKTPKRRKSLCVNVKRSPRSSSSVITGGKSQSTKLTQWLVKNSNAQMSDSPGKSLTTKRRRLDLSFPDK